MLAEGFPGGDWENEMARNPAADDADAGTPLSIESAFRRVRLLAGVLILARFFVTSSLPVLAAIALVLLFWSINFVSLFAQRQNARRRAVLGIVQLFGDTLFVLLVVIIQHGRTGSDSADWAVLVLPVIEGAIRYQIPGAIASWAVLAGGYAGWNMRASDNLAMSTVAQRLTVVFLVALPCGFLAEHLVAEIAAHRSGRADAERRSALLRAAALGGERSSRLDVDEILQVLRTTVSEMGFSDPLVFELCGTDTTRFAACPVRHSRETIEIAPGDPRLVAAAAARAANQPTVWPPPAGQASAPATRARDRAAAHSSMLFALPIRTVDDAFVVLTARWSRPDEPPASQTESLELFAAQAGASLNNAQVHRELQALKDRLAHEASHDALTDLPNRRRFTEELERMCGRGRPGDMVAVLFLDLDGFKDVNDRYGHDAGNDLLMAVAARLRDCVRPGDVVARMGGDEFTIMLTRLESVAPAVEVAERICSVLADPFSLRSRQVGISTSIGIAVTPADRADSGDLLRRADVAMYRAKSQGKAGWAMDPTSLEPAGGTDG